MLLFGLIGFGLICLFIGWRIKSTYEERRKSNNRASRCDGDGWVGFGVVLWIVSIALFMIIHFTALARIVGLEAWYTSNAQLSKHAIVEASNQAIVFGHMPKDKVEEFWERTLMLSQNELLNLDNFQHSSKVVEMIISYRRSMVKYNEDLRFYQRISKHWFLWPMYPTVPDYLEPMDY